MRAASVVLLFAHLTFTVVATGRTPDYYSRTPESVMAWVYSRGLWAPIISALFTICLGVIAARARGGWTIFAATISLVLTLVWLFRPYWFSVLGDMLYFRFP
jgi:hypothetical protein